MFEKLYISIFALSFFCFSCCAQETKAQSSNEPGIQDNSFLVEEAYNQNFGVVQHISSFTRFFDSKDWVYTFTQEWPMGGMRHQFSYTVPLGRVGESSGLGDVLLNYRYQLASETSRRPAVSPRLSVIVPTGNESSDLASGAGGVVVNLPAGTQRIRMVVDSLASGGTQLNWFTITPVR